MSFAVRLATPSDAERLARLRLEFRATLGQMVEPEAVFVARCAAWMAERLRAQGRWRCWAVERDGEVVGHLWIQLIEKVPNPLDEPERHAYITNVYVQPHARGAGAGEALVATAVEWCRAEGVDSVILWPTSRSRSLYSRHGFAVRDDVMEAVLNRKRSAER